MSLLGRLTAHMWKINVTGHFSWILTTLEPTVIATRGGYEITEAQYVQVHFMQLYFNTALLFAFLLTANGAVNSLSCRVHVF